MITSIRLKIKTEPCMYSEDVQDHNGGIIAYVTLSGTELSVLVYVTEKKCFAFQYYSHLLISKYSYRFAAQTRKDCVEKALEDGRIVKHFQHSLDFIRYANKISQHQPYTEGTK